MSEVVRTRFAPSPTGYLHIGGARTALFNWLLARKYGGQFVLRIEDTDKTRNIEGAVEKILEDLRWLGLDWDEGPEVGGPYGPYFQSQRLEIYEQYYQRLLDSGNAYYAFDTPEELERMRKQAMAEKRPFRYPRPKEFPTARDVERARAEGRPVVIRFKMPDRDITVHDEILGEVTVRAEELEDFVIRKSDGWPTYHFACVVDDELMRITHVLRGQEHLMNTPKHIALQDALGFRRPVYAHVPLILNPDGSKMSKRDKEKDLREGRPPREIDVHDFRAAGYLPEVLVNFIALLGWSPGDDREKFTLQELVERFDVRRISKTAARFDRDKLIAFNTQAVAQADEERLLAAFKDYLQVNDTPLRDADDETLRRLLRMNAGFRTFRDVDEKSRFFFLSDEQIQYDEKAVRKVLEKGSPSGFEVLEEVLPQLESLETWDAESVERLIRSVCEAKGLGLGKVAQPIRVAVCGTTVSPPIFDTLEFLGRQRTINRIRRCLSVCRAPRDAD